MFLAHLPLWYVWPARPANPDACLPASACTGSGVRPRATAAVVEVTVRQTQDEMRIRIKGEAKVECAGALLDALLTATSRRPAVVTLDLSELRSISSLAMGVLVSYRRGVVRRGGRVRLTEQLQPAVKESLARADLLDLFEMTEAVQAVPNQDLVTALPGMKKAS